MSVVVKIGNQAHDLAQADKHWIFSQIKDQQNDNGSVCVQVVIQDGDVNLRLCSGACQLTGGGGWQPNAKERLIIDLWNKSGGAANPLAGGEIWAFVNQLQRFL